MAMALDKAIAHGKEKRKPYTGSKAFVSSCRNHGGCEWCEGNRRHKFRDKRPDERGSTTLNMQALLIDFYENLASITDEKLLEELEEAKEDSKDSCLLDTQ